jgi:pentatricopeptide repeat protein
MQFPSPLPFSSSSGIVSTSEEIYLFCFFWIGFFAFRKGIFQNYLCPGRKSADCKKVIQLVPVALVRDDFAHGRYENVLEAWAGLEEHTPEALALVVTSLLALGRPDDIGDFVARSSATLPHLKAGLHQVVTAIGAPACEVRRQYSLWALRDLYERARHILDKSAMSQLLLFLAKFNDQVRVEALLAELRGRQLPADAELLSNLVRSFLACQNLDASLGYLRQTLVATSPTEYPPHALILEVVKASTEADISDESIRKGLRATAWEAMHALEGIEVSSEALLLFLEWAARQTPVDVAMTTHVEQLLRKGGPLPIEAYDALIRVHANSGGDSAKAEAYFDEFVQQAGDTQASESSLVGMISACMEARNFRFAEHIASWACRAARCTLPVFSATLKVLVAADKAERVCALYEAAVAQQDLVLDEHLLEQLSAFAARSGHRELQQRLSKGTNKQDAQNQLNIMRSLAQEGNIEEVLKLLEEMREQEIAMDALTWNCALDACVSHGDAAAAAKLFEDMKSSGHLDVASYNIMLKQCCSAGASPEVCKDILEEMRSQGLKPNTATFNSLLSCAMTVGDFQGVWQTIHEMEISSQAADIYTLSILFKGYRRERRSMDAETIDKALSLIRKHAVKVDESLIHVALEAALALRDTGCLRKTLDTFWGSGWSIPQQASLHTYGLLIKAYGQMQGLSEVWQLWSEVTDVKGLEPSEQLYGQMLDVLVSNNSLDDALAIFQEMKTTHKKSLNSQGFAVAYAMIIRGYAQQKDCGRALHCYEEMKSEGTKASLVVLNTLIDACSRVGDMASAAKLFRDMGDSNYEPDLITYSTLIKGYCISEELEQALQLFGVMQEKGIRPDAIVFNSLLDGSAKKHTPALCEQLIKDMEAAGVKPSSHSASIMIKLYGRCKDLGAAFRVIDEMPRKYGFRANAAVYTCLMSACISNGELEQAMELRIRMRDDAVWADEKTYSTLLRGALRASSVEHCSMLVHEALDNRGAKPRNLLDEDVVRSVLVLMQRQNAWEPHGRELQSRLRSCGISVRTPLPPDSCSRNDGFGQGRQRDFADNKRNFASQRDQGHGKDVKYQQQRRHEANPHYVR